MEAIQNPNSAQQQQEAGDPENQRHSATLARHISNSSKKREVKETQYSCPGVFLDVEDPCTYQLSSLCTIKVEKSGAWHQLISLLERLLWTSLQLFLLSLDSVDLVVESLQHQVKRRKLELNREQLQKGVDDPQYKETLKHHQKHSKASFSQKTLMADPEGSNPTSLLGGSARYQNTPPLIVQPPIFKMPMPMPGSEGMPFFTGSNAKDFTRRFEETCDDFNLTDEEKRKRLPRYADNTRRRQIEGLPEWINGESFADVAAALHEEFADSDPEQLKVSLTFLEQFVKLDRGESEVRPYVREYHAISQELVNKSILSGVDQGRYFLLGLPKRMRDKLIVKFKVVHTKPESYRKYSEFREEILLSSKSDQTIQALELQKQPTEDYKNGITRLVHQFSDSSPVRIDQAPPVVPINNTAAKVDELSAAMERLRLFNLQVSQTLTQRTTPEFGSQATHLSQGQRYAGYSQQDSRAHIDLSGNVEVNSTKVYKDIRDCPFCENRYDAPPHAYRDACPFFRQMVDNNTIHVSDYGRLCLGPRRPEAVPLKKNRSNLDWVGEIRLRTSGTDWDVNVENRQDTPIFPPSVTMPLPQILRRGDPLPESVTKVGQVSLAGWASEGSSSLDLEVMAVASKEKGKTVRFKNPTKVAKPKTALAPSITRRLEREANYGIAGARNSQSPESGDTIVVDADELGEEEPREEEAAAEDAVEGPTPVSLKAPSTRGSKALRNRFVDLYTGPEARRRAIEKLMNGVHLHLRDIVALQENIFRIINQKAPIVPETGGNDYTLETPEQASLLEPSEVFGNPRALEVNVIGDLKTVIRRCPALAMKTPKIEVTLNEKAVVTAVLDTGAEVNIMSRAFADAAKLTILKGRTITFSTISRKNMPFDGLIKNVSVNAGGIAVYTDFFVVASTQTDVLLGMPYLLETKFTLKYPGDGTVQAVLEDLEGVKGFVTVAGDESVFGEHLEETGNE